MTSDVGTECLINGVQYKCRTCFDPGETIYSLNDEASNTKTWRDLLKDIAQLQTHHDNELLPKTLCCKCLDKLKKSYDFVLQVNSVNDKYSQLLTKGGVLNEADNFTDCLAESAIALPLEQYMPEIKMEEELVVAYDVDMSNNKLQSDDDSTFENEDTNDPFTETFDEEFKSTSGQLEENERFIVNSLDSDCNSNDYRGEFSSSSSNESTIGSPSRQPSEQNKVSDGDLIEKTDKGYLCTICKKTFTLARNCRRHVDTIHFRQIKDPPKFHGEEFDFENSLQQSTIFKSNEIKTNIQYWPFGSRIYSKPTAWSLVECKLCNTNFKTCKQLRQHLENHRDIETLYSLELTDNIVQYLFPNMIDLNLIKDNIIKDIRKKQWFKYYTVVNKYTYEMSISDTEEEDLEEESTERAYKYKCAFCTKGFSYKYLVHSHLNEAHKMEVIPFKCSHCKLKFVSIKMYNQHLQTHCLNLHKVLLCQNCPGKFVWPENIKNHTCATKLTAILPAPPKEHEKTPKHQEHLQPLPAIAIFRCCLCEHSFQKLQHLRQHMPLHADGKTGIDFKGCIYVKQFENSKPIDYEMLQQQIKNNYSKCQISRFYQAMDKYGNEMDISDSDSDICKEEFQNVEKEYKCEVCNDMYKNRKYLLKHQQERHNNVNMPFTCKDCKQQYVSIHLLQQHLKRECSNENRRTAQQCEFCNVRFIWPNNLLKHKEIMHGIIIEPSSSTSASGSSLLPKTVTTATVVTSDITTIGMIQTTQKTDRKFVCSFCRVSYSNNSTLTVHIMTQHSDEKPFKCAHCDMAFKRANDLQSHRLTHPGEHLFKCTFCEKSFSRLIELKTHKRTHKNDLINHHCTICQKSFKRPFSLKRHMFTHTGEKPYKCDICGKTFVCSAYLQKHREMVCNDLWSTPVNVPDCKVLENPTKNVKTKKLCPICGIYLSKNTSLTNHVRTHTGYKPFKCDLCEMSFLRRGDLLEHRRTHTKERPFECPHCDKSFAKKRRLNDHIRLHTGERPYQCTICKKSFNKSDYLKIHMRGHTGEKPFKCNFCGQGFICGAYLKKHQISKGHLDENK